MPLQLMVTAAGLDALVDAQNGDTDPIQVIEIGLTSTAFVMAPTLTALPGEFKRLDTIAGQSVSENIIHMTATDGSEDIYDLRGIGLFLADGTLFAVYGQADPLFRKVSIAAFLLAFDIAFVDAVDAAIEFGDSTFLFPPASETVKGVAELATQAEVDAGLDDSRIVTPAKLKVILEALAAAVNADIDGVSALLTALLARTITGSGLITGGGNLTASRVLQVLAASAGDVATGTAADRAVTPAALSGLARSLTTNGYGLVPGMGGLMMMWGRFTAIANGATSVTFPTSFNSACFIVLVDGTTSGGTDSKDNPASVVRSTITTGGFGVWSADDGADDCCFWALGI